MSEAKKDLARYWTDFLMKEFVNETDRGAVVLTASLLENALTNILKRYLTPSPNAEDELLDSTAPLSSFSAKIQISQRVGLISSRLARDLNIIRKMRNEFAHNIHGSSLESGKIKDLLTNLITSSGIVKGHEVVKSIYPPGARGSFLMVASIILHHLQASVESAWIVPLTSLEEEWIYSWSYKSEKKESEQSK